MSWRGGDGVLQVTVDGRALPPRRLAAGRELPASGTLLVGLGRSGGGGRAAGGLTGAVDEVAWYDRVIDPSRMLSHVLVARRVRPPTPDQASLPVEVRGRSGPAGPVVSLAISPDGRVAALGSADNSAGLWDLQTGNLLRALSGHTDVVDSVAISPDGRLAATATGGSFDLLKDADLTVKLWDVATGRLLHDLRGHTAAVTALAFDPNGRYLASAGRDKMACLWDTSDGRLRHALGGHADEVISVAFSPDGRRLAAGVGFREMVGEAPDPGPAAVARVWDVATGALAYDVIDRRGRMAALAFSPDGTLLATAGGAGVMLRDAANGRPVRKLWNAAAFAVAFGPGGQRLLAGCTDGKARLWEVATGRLLHDYEGHPSRPWILTYSPDGRVVATTDADSEVRLWDAEGGRLLHALRGHQARVSTMRFSPDGVQLVSGSNDQTAIVWTTGTGQRVSTLAARREEIDVLAFDRQRQTLVIGGPDGTIRVWNISEGKLHGILRGHPGKVTAAVISPDGRLALSGSSDGSVKLWDLRARYLFKELTPHHGIVTRVAVSPDGKLVGSAGTDAVVQLSEARTGRHLRTLAGHTKSVDALVFSPDSKWLVTGGADGAVLIWDAQNNGPPRTFLGHTGGVKAFHFTVDGRLLASVASDAVILWNPENGKLLRSFRPLKGIVTSGDLSSDGRLVVTGGSFGSVTLWDPQTGHPVAALQSDQEPSPTRKFFESTVSVAFSPDGRQLLSHGLGSTIRVWEVGTTRLRVALDRPGGPVRSAVFDPEGKLIASGGEDGICLLWDIASARHVMISNVGDEWVFSSDEGLFDSSPAGYSLVAAVQGSRSFGIDQLAPRNNRPDLLLERLGLGSAGLRDHLKALHTRRLREAGVREAEVASQADLPQAQIVWSQPAATHGSVELEIVLRDRQGLKGYQVYVNDVPLFAGLGKPISGRRVRVREQVPLTGGTNKLEVAALSTRGQESLRALAFEEGPGVTPGTLYFIGFGVSRYKNQTRIPDLSFADKDAKDLAELFSRMEGPYRDRRIRALVNDQVTVSAVKGAKSFLVKAHPEDTVVLFIAGHGVHDSDPAATYYYLTHEADPDNLPMTAANFEIIEALLDGIAPRRKLFLMDTCQSGELFDEAPAVGDGIGAGDAELKPRLVPGGIYTMRNVGPVRSHVQPRRYLTLGDRFIDLDLRRRSGAIVLSSCRGDEASWESASYRNGAFTSALIRALSSDAADADRDGLVSTRELRFYVEQEVPKLTRDRQHPTVDRDNIYQTFGFPIARSLGSASGGR